MTAVSAAPSALDASAVQQLAAAMRGPLIQPDDPDYHQARTVWNGMIDRYPALIARCAGVADVLAAVAYARTSGLTIAVRGGGHSAAGNGVCDGGIVIDVSQMKGIRVDPVMRTARAQAGVTWGEFDAETQAFGLATTGGVISTTGIAGLTLGGGIGWLMRKYGLTCDNLLSADVVTADGRVVTASATEHPDLFWGLRGGGGNVGVVTSFEYRLHLVDEVLAGRVALPLERARESLRFFREFTASAPDELTTYFNLTGDPDLGPIVAIDGCYAGTIATGEVVLKPLRSFGPPLADWFKPMRYQEFNTTDPATVFPAGDRNYWKSSFLQDLSDAAIETLVAQFAAAPSPTTCMLVVEHMGGAINRIHPDETAFAHRDVSYNLVIIATGFAADGDDRHMAWVRETWAAMQPFTRDAVYLNYLGSDDANRITSAFSVATYNRLAALKRTCDPTSLFPGNQTIAPPSSVADP